MTEQHPPYPPRPTRPDPGVTEYRQGTPPVPPPDPFRTHSAPKKKRHGLAWLIVGIVAVLGVGIASAGSGGDDAAQLHNDAGVGTTTDHSATKPQEPQKAEVDLETTAQANARASAEDYLSTMPFSKKGLIHQLRFEGYSAADARYGVRAVDADWYEQAVESAEDYLDTMPFSEADLVDQLEFEGFTSAQAEHGARVAYR